jgi:alkane 1-monooxygenase
MKSLRYVATLIVPAMTAAAVFWRGPWLWLPPAFLFLITPALDMLLGQDKRDVDDSVDAAAWRDLRYDLWLWLWAPLQLAVQLAALSSAATATTPELVGISFASGLLGAIGINMAHELMHRKGAPERALAEVLLTTVSYAHFSVEHVLGHHKNVATPDDPGTARRGDVVYPFVARSVVLSVISAWRLERARVQKLAVPFGLRDRRVRYPLALAAVVVAVGFAFGPMAVVVFVAQSAVAIFLLETINYIEHYGLERRRVDGAYERVEPAHSWSSAHRLTCWYLLNLPRHADHHANASRPFFALRHVDDGPQMPQGYATMLVLALVPPLWRAVMHPRLDDPAVGLRRA